MERRDFSKEDFEQCFIIEETDNENGYTLYRKILSTCGAGKKGDVIEMDSRPTSNGYCSVRFKDDMINYHIIVWTMLFGKPTDEEMIDHINGVRHDNRLSNLRLTKNNMHNRVEHREGKLLGVCEYKGRFQASIIVNGKTLSLGAYSSAEEASEVVLKAISLRDINMASSQEIADSFSGKNKHKCLSNVIGVTLSKGYWRVRVFKNNATIILGDFKDKSFAEGLALKAYELKNSGRSLEEIEALLKDEISEKKDKEKRRTSKFKYVSFHTPSNKWSAYPTIMGKRIYLGLYNTEEEANQAILEHISSQNVHWVENEVLHNIENVLNC